MIRPKWRHLQKARRQMSKMESRHQGTIFDAPDPELTALAAQINGKARAGKVSFIARIGEISLIFAAGSRRRVIDLDGRPTDGDIDAIVTALESWAGFQEEGSAYSTEIPPLPDSGW